jgi:hypothetical protein
MYTIQHCDNLSFMRSLPSELFDFIYGDLPFLGVKSGKNIFPQKTSSGSMTSFLTPRIFEMNRLLSRGGFLLLHINAAMFHQVITIVDRIDDFPSLKEVLVFSRVKDKTRRGKNLDLFLQLCLVFEKKPVNLSRDPSEKLSPVITHVQSDQFLWGKDEIFYRPFQKSIALMSYLLKRYGFPQKKVGDFFCGSGTTGVVCRELGIDFVLCDIDEEAVLLAKKRFR